MRKSRLATLVISAASAIGILVAVATPASAASSVHYVALGDSYSAGLGAGSYIGSSGSCDRSKHSYSALWALAHKPASYKSVACSGATTSTVINSQLSALSAETTLVSMTIGGNDVGFFSIIKTCALEGTSACVAAVNAAETYAKNTLPSSLNTLFTDIRTHAPHAHVVILDYPIFYRLGTLCFGLSSTSHKKIDQGINLLDGIEHAAAKQHGFTFADVRKTFVGHQLCSYGSKWLHGLDITDIADSYHPTLAGQSHGYLPIFTAAATKTP